MPTVQCRISEVPPDGIPPGLTYLRLLDGAEEVLDDPQPLKALKNIGQPTMTVPASGKPKAQLFLRYKDTDPQKTTLIVYGGWLRYSTVILSQTHMSHHLHFRIPVTFCSVTIGSDATVETVIAEALTKFGLTFCDFSTYNLVEVSLDRGGKLVSLLRTLENLTGSFSVVERSLERNENMLQEVQSLRNVSQRVRRLWMHMWKRCPFRAP